MQSDEEFAIDESTNIKAEIQELNPENHPYMNYNAQTQNVLDKTVEVHQKEKLPDLQGEIFTSVNKLFADRRYSGFQVGVGVPLFGNKSYDAKIKSAELEKNVVELQKQNFLKQYQARYDALLQDIEKYEKALLYYEQTGKKLGKEIIRSANIAYKNGEIDFLDYVQLLESAKKIEINYLENLNLYNQSVLELNYLD